MKFLTQTRLSAKRRSSQMLGQSSVEYIVLTAAIAFALGIGMVDENSVLSQLLNAFSRAYQKISFAISLP